MMSKLKFILCFIVVSQVFATSFLKYQFDSSINLLRNELLNQTRHLVAGGNDVGNGAFTVLINGENYLVDLQEIRENQMINSPIKLFADKEFDFLLDKESKKLLKKFKFNKFKNFSSHCDNESCTDDAISFLNLLSVYTYLTSGDCRQGFFKDLQSLKWILVIDRNEANVFRDLYSYPSELVLAHDSRTLLKPRPAARVIGDNVFISLSVWNTLNISQKSALLVHESLQYLTTKYMALSESERYFLRAIVRLVFVDSRASVAKSIFSNNFRGVLNECSK